MNLSPKKFQAHGAYTDVATHTNLTVAYNGCTSSLGCISMLQAMQLSGATTSQCSTSSFCLDCTWAAKHVLTRCTAHLQPSWAMMQSGHQAPVVIQSTDQPKPIGTVSARKMSMCQER